MPDFKLGFGPCKFVKKKKKNCRRHCRVKRTFETNDTYIYV